MTPIGHLSFNFIFGYKLEREYLIYFILGGILPDVDFLLIWSDSFNKYHRIVTHNVFFVFFVSLALATIFSSPKKYIKVIGVSFIGGILHLLVDSFLDSNPSNGIGVSFFYPFVKEPFSFFNFSDVFENPYTWNDPIKFIKNSYSVLIFEIPFILLAMILFFSKK